ncbi:Transducin/WD40 repeat-like superfamily protein [Arabidopsis thaliana]|jgi:ribosome biogenesis protein YTM1|uniref:Ribosome biogenesis protein WDR12 homolog n=1 Tax=Arabidopsis thaliana TaxID=3702 RepID=F4KB59_ARATH|nr:Transducin/WD40 repeat-like superfamily protein [Arabidopsis thaliana]AED92177.1 Transducin/WD40 repeat-like superfamily protein [Arabidopsis thaliana]|eukprot:NP_974784.1 Transducin/WD40 repeat-like superfamily protein [Arabidopsis thaliana]
MDIDGEDVSRRLHVKFVTKLDSPFKVPVNSVAIPSNVTRLGLSSIVNSIIESENPEWKTEPFDFLIDGELIRMSLEEFLLAKGISAERTLEIEYIRAVTPRKEEEPSLHDDWVSAVNGSSPRFILTGCYDGLGRVWSSAGSCSHILEGHSGAISSVALVNSNDAETVTVATASKDRTLRLFKFDPAESVDSTTKVRAYKILRGHKASVQSVSAQKSGNMVCSSSWDCTINLWNTNESTSEGESVSVKKRKGNNQAEESQSEGEAVTSLVGHTQCVSSVVWPEHDVIYSSSWDHSVRRWDVETGKDSLNLFCGKALNTVDVGGESSALIAAGGSDPILRVWDPRKPGTSAPVFQFSSHSSWISACKWHKSSWFHLLSASYDGKIMLWDLRTAVMTKHTHSFPL